MKKLLNTTEGTVREGKVRKRVGAKGIGDGGCEEQGALGTSERQINGNIAFEMEVCIGKTGEGEGQKRKSVWGKW